MDLGDKKMRFVKLNENELEVTNEVTMKDTQGNDVSVYDENTKRVVTRNFLEQSIVNIDSQIVLLNDRVKREAMIAELNKAKTEHQAALAELDSP